MSIRGSLLITGGTGTFGNAVAARVLAAQATDDGGVSEVRIFSRDAYVSLDYDKRQALLVRKSPLLTRAALEKAAGGAADLSALAGVDFGDLLRTEMLPIDDGEPLREEIRAFVSAVRTGARPKVSGAEGLRALALAERILAAIAARPRPDRASAPASAAGAGDAFPVGAA